VVADRPGRVGLIRQDHVRPGARTTTLSGNTQTGHDVGEGGCITGLAGSENEGEGPAASIGREVDLGGQPAAGPADGVVGRFAGRGPLLRAPAACW
jgi:hypothetical protein